MAVSLGFAGDRPTESHIAGVHRSLLAALVHGGEFAYADGSFPGNKCIIDQKILVLAGGQTGQG